MEEGRTWKVRAQDIRKAGWSSRSTDPVEGRQTVISSWTDTTCQQPCQIFDERALQHPLTLRLGLWMIAPLLDG